MNDTVRIRLSVGLLLVALVHAVVLAGLGSYLNLPATDIDAKPWQLPAATTVDNTYQGSVVSELPKPAPSVNQAAQSELKQGILFNRRQANTSSNTTAYTSGTSACQPCNPQAYSYPALNPNSTTSYPILAPSPTTTTVSKPLEVQPPSVLVTKPSEPASLPASNAKPATELPIRSYQLALFLGSDAKSQAMIAWFKTNPDLVKLRSQCDFQAYTPTNALYQSRFKESVPVEQFPVIILQDTTGGHVHAAAGNMIPATAEALLSDLRTSYTLYEQAKSAEKTGLIKTSGYSWDAAIDPSMQLSLEDCVDGRCPLPTQDPWRPADRLRDGLFDRANDSAQAVLWAGASEVVLLGLFVVAAFLIVFIVLKRGIV